VNAVGSPMSTRPYRPSWFQRQANTFLTRALRNGRGPSFMRLLSVTGRTTARVFTTPIVPVHDGDRYWLISPFGDVGWVRNVRAGSPVTLERGDDGVTGTFRELDAEEATPILRTYLSSRARLFVRKWFDVSAHSTDAEITAEAPRHPVFELIPA
jgi:deazaflavin-dependent oxidoreductase (nitroreductase family)